MNFKQALDLLKKVHNNDGGRYINDLAEKIDGFYTMAIKRKTQDKIAVLREFWGDDDGCAQPLDFSECSFLYTDKDGKSLAYPFTCEDFFADDWECFIFDTNGDYDYSALKGELQESFSQYLTELHDDSLLDYDSAVAKIKKLYAEYGSDKIGRVDIIAVFGDVNEPFYRGRIDLSGSNYEVKDWHIFDCLEKLGYGKSDVFEIEVTLTSGESNLLASWEV